MRDKKKVIPPSPSPSASSSSSLIRNYQFASIENRICNILMNITSNKVSLSLCVCKLFLMIITMDEQQQQKKYPVISSCYTVIIMMIMMMMIRGFPGFFSFFLFLQFKLKFNNSSHVYHHQTVCVVVGWLVGQNVFIHRLHKSTPKKK